MTSETTPAPKPLLLGNTPGLAIEQDGPALRIRLPRRADRLLPLARLSRIVSPASAQWSTQALLTCAAQGIPLLFVDSQGGVIARLLGGSPPSLPANADLAQDLLQRLRTSLTRPDWPGIHHDWKLGREHQAMQQVRRRLGMPGQLAGLIQARRWLRGQWHLHLGAEGAIQLMRYSHSLLESRCLAALGGVGFNANHAVARHPQLPLAGELAVILHWSLAPGLLAHLRSRRHARRGQARKRPGPLSTRRLTELVEKQAQWLEQPLQQLIREFHLHLIELD